MHLQKGTKHPIPQAHSACRSWCLTQCGTTPLCKATTRCACSANLNQPLSCVDHKASFGADATDAALSCWAKAPSLATCGVLSSFSPASAAKVATQVGVGRRRCHQGGPVCGMHLRDVCAAGPLIPNSIAAGRLLPSAVASPNTKPDQFVCIRAGQVVDNCNPQGE